MAQKEMAKLEAKLNKLKGKLQETDSYTITLEYMLERLQKKKLTFETTMTAYEEALRVQEEELAEVKVLLGEVKQAKQTEEHALQKMQDLAQQQKVELEEKLEQRRLEAVQREEITKYEEVKRIELATAQAVAQGDLSAEQEQHLIMQEKSMRLKTRTLKNKTRRLQQEIEDYDNMLKRLKLATGLPEITADAVINKYVPHLRPLASSQPNLSTVARLSLPTTSLP